ncbi:hypothetical protein LOK49_LG02G02302 [Camellia lanceoleosa]|uniref:Uncharacterized protein n=1 Tax=Camellia lanceoleosa TaxID=1840588 RepID=A0ACC0ISQ1_9ERIC|nr:hypothetical protein LOK49_LG02G02302 [Camellia lanceoleosa]
MVLLPPGKGHRPWYCHQVGPSGLRVPQILFRKLGIHSIISNIS